MADKKQYVKTFRQYFGMVPASKYSKEDLAFYNEMDKTIVNSNIAWEKEVDNRIAEEEKSAQIYKNERANKAKAIEKEVTELHRKSLEEITEKYNAADEEYQKVENEIHKGNVPQQYIDELNSLESSMNEVKNKYAKFNTVQKETDGELIWERKDRNFENLVSLIEDTKKNNPEKDIRDIAIKHLTSKDALALDFNMNRVMLGSIQDYIETKKYDNAFPENIKNYIDENNIESVHNYEVEHMVSEHVHNQMKAMPDDICEYINRKQAFIDKQEQSPSLALSRQRTEKQKARNELYKQKSELEYTLVKKLVKDEIKDDKIIQALDEQIANHQKEADDLKKYKEMRHGLATDIKDVNPEQVKFAKQEYFKAKGEYEKLNGWQKFWADRLPVSLYKKAELVAKIDAYKEVFNDLGVTPETLDAEYAKDVKEKENKSLADEVNKIEQIDINGKDEVRVKDDNLNMALGDLTDLEKGAQKNDVQKSQYKRFEVQLDNEDKKIDAPQINVPKN